MRIAALIAIALLPPFAPEAPPARRIIQVADYHYVCFALFQWDITDQAVEAGERLTEDDLCQLWGKYLDEVRAVQDEQEAVLRRLIRNHGLRVVYLEGASDQETLDRELAKARQGKGDALLTLGAAGRLALEGLITLAPAEDAEAHAAGSPFDPEGFDNTDAIEAREDAIVRRLLRDESRVTVVVLGSAHDLQDNVDRLAGDAVYERIEPEAVRRATGN